MGNSLGEAFGCLVFVLVVLVLLVMGLFGFLVNDKVGPTVIESKTITKPDYRLEANGKKVDTIYIYKFE